MVVLVSALVPSSKFSSMRGMLKTEATSDLPTKFCILPVSGPSEMRLIIVRNQVQNWHFEMRECFTATGVYLCFIHVSMDSAFSLLILTAPFPSSTHPVT